jgi:hypothetical protein
VQIRRCVSQELSSYVAQHYGQHGSLCQHQLGGAAWSVLTFVSMVCAAVLCLCVCPAVYDYEYTSPERGTFKKLVFLLW